MFARLGSFSVRYRWYIIAAWLAIAAILTLLAPDIDQVAVSDQRAFLPSSAPSLHAHETVAKYFPDRVSPSSAVLVVDAGQGNQVDQGPSGQFITDLTAWLTSSEAPEAVEEVWSPTRGDEQTRAELVSENKQVALLLVRFNAIGTQPTTVQALHEIEDRLKQAPTGVKAYMTGDGPILSAYTSSSRKSVDSTTLITIILVIVILLVIYRSPVSPLIPLLTITLAYLISRAVVAYLGEHVLTISMYTNVFLIVVLFGAGTDYCLFLISRFREEMTGMRVAGPAVKTTVKAVGETITSSAATVIVGLALMATAELGLYNTSGPSIAIGVAIALIAGLTLTPAMLSILGPYAFWPRVAHRNQDRGAWHAWADKVIKQPWLGFAVPAVVLVALAIYGAGLDRDFNLIGDLSLENQARRGFDVLAEHFGPGEMQPLNVVVTDPTGYSTPSGLAQIDRLEGLLRSLPHVATVRSFYTSIQDRSFLLVSNQLTQLSQEVRSGAEKAQAALDQISASGAQSEQSTSDNGQIEQIAHKAAADIQGIYSYMIQLVAAYPEVLREQGYEQAAQAFGELQKVAQEFDSAPSAEDGLASNSSSSSLELVRRALLSLQSLADGLTKLGTSFATRPAAILLPDLYVQRNEGLALLRRAYISEDGTAARLQVVLDSSPYSPAALAAVQQIRQVLADQGFSGVVEGNSAVLLDLRDAADRDIKRAMIFVLGGVFAVLVVLLRALVAPVYLILTILLSYTATLGVVRVVFVDVLGADGVTWWVPMFMFVMLVALGMDYNIFLVGRIKEEVGANGTVHGTRLALARTGGIITSAGIILAGTFASMISGQLLGLMQIGFAVAFGVLLDTFVVRTTLVPAITVLLRRWAWWPRRTPAGSSPQFPEETGRKAS